MVLYLLSIPCSPDSSLLKAAKPDLKEMIKLEERERDRDTLRIKYESRHKLVPYGNFDIHVSR